jgi:hypothetical protein
MGFEDKIRDHGGMSKGMAALSFFFVATEGHDNRLRHGSEQEHQLVGRP